MVLEVNNVGWQKVLSTPAQRGMVVVFVVPNQPAAKGGLNVGDVVSKMNGTDLWNANVTNREIRKLKVGDKVSLDVQRKNGAAKVDLTVEPAQPLDLPAMMNAQVQKDSNNAASYFLRGAYADKDAQSATADYTQAINLNGDFVSAYVQRATLLEPTAPDKAMQDDQKAVSLDNTDPGAYANLGIGFVNGGKFTDALNAENTALQIDPQFGPALLYRGLMYRDASRTDLQNATATLKDAKLRTLAQTTLDKTPS
jgi:tetratricopeptide (TPR) repeat protein